MHPVLFEIPVSFWTVAAVGILFFFGGLVGTRFKPAPRDSSYLAAYLGLNVQWGVVASPWDASTRAGLKQGAFAGLVAIAGYFIAQRQSPPMTGVPLHIYGVMMATAFVNGIYLATREARHQNLPPVPIRDEHGVIQKDKDGKVLTINAADLVSDLSFYLLISGLLGSNVLYNVTRWDEKHIPGGVAGLAFWKWWDLGLVWYGGLIAAFLTAWWFVRKHQISFWPYADALVPGASIGHALGRLGCFAAGCCFGNPASEEFPLAVHFPEGSPAFKEHLSMGLIDHAATHSAAVYPTQIMESLGEVAIFFALLFIRSRKRFHGQVVLAYFGLYSILRFLMEMVRGDRIRGFFFKWPNAEHPLLMSTSQGVSILMAIGGIGLTVMVIRQKNRAAREAEAAASPSVS